MHLLRILSDLPAIFGRLSVFSFFSQTTDLSVRTCWRYPSVIRYSSKHSRTILLQATDHLTVLHKIYQWKPMLVAHSSLIHYYRPSRPGHENIHFLQETSKLFPISWLDIQTGRALRQWWVANTWGRGWAGWKRDRGKLRAVRETVLCTVSLLAWVWVGQP